jgi:tetratricopeptide (TPR) repeat protein
MAGRAYVLYRGGNLEEALELAQRALAYNPQQGQAHYVIGLILIEQGEYDAALGELEPLSAIEDTWEYDYPFFYRQVGHEVFYDMARAAIGMGDNDLALEFLNQSISRDDWWPDVHILKAQVHQYRGETDLAREELLYALEIATQTVGREAQADEIRQMIEEL